MRKNLVSLAALAASAFGIFDAAAAFPTIRPTSNPSGSRERNAVPEWSRAKKLEVAKHNVMVDAKKHARKQRQLQRLLGAR